MEIIDPYEIKLVMQHRISRAEVSLKLEKVDKCKHLIREYAGHSHKDDAYKCKSCGHIEWR